MTKPTAGQSMFYQSLRDAFQRATGKDFERIYPRLLADCVACSGKDVPCRQMLDTLGNGCGGPLCLECFHLILWSGLAQVHGANDLLPIYEAEFHFRAIGKFPPELAS